MKESARLETHYFKYRDVNATLSRGGILKIT